MWLQRVRKTIDRAAASKPFAPLIDMHTGNGGASAQARECMDVCIIRRLDYYRVLFLKQSISMYYEELAVCY